VRRKWRDRAGGRDAIERGELTGDEIDALLARASIADQPPVAVDIVGRRRCVNGGGWASD
jgi:hypothetical protein